MLSHKLKFFLCFLIAFLIYLQFDVSMHSVNILILGDAILNCLVRFTSLLGIFLV